MLTTRAWAKHQPRPSWGNGKKNQSKAGSLHRSTACASKAHVLSGARAQILTLSGSRIALMLTTSRIALLMSMSRIALTLSASRIALMLSVSWIALRFLGKAWWAQTRVWAFFFWHRFWHPFRHRCLHSCWGERSPSLLRFCYMADRCGAFSFSRTPLACIMSGAEGQSRNQRR